MIECYYSRCPHHSCNSGDEGPFCDRSDCIATEDERAMWQAERDAQLKQVLKQTTYQLSEDERRDIHNGICDLNRVVLQLSNIIHPKLLTDLNSAIDTVARGFATVSKQESDVLDAKHTLYSHIKNELGLKYAVWSMYDVVDFDAPFRPHFNIPSDAEVTLAYNGVNAIVSPEQTTWKDLFKHADNAIKRSQDYHHVFVENFSVKTDSMGFILKMITGS